MSSNSESKWIWDSNRRRYFTYDSTKGERVWRDGTREPSSRGGTPYSDIVASHYTSPPPTTSLSGSTATRSPQPLGGTNDVSNPNQGLQAQPRHQSHDRQYPYATLRQPGLTSTLSMNDPTLDQPGIRAHRTQFERTNTEKLDSGFRVHRSQFFVPGRVFLVFWVEPAGSSARHLVKDEAHSSTIGDEAVYSKLRRFVVIRQGTTFCSAIPAVSYGHRGVGKPGVTKSDHCVIFTGEKPKPILPSEIPSRGEQGMRAVAIRVIPDELTDRLSDESRLHLGAVYTVQFNVKVKPFGNVHAASLPELQSLFAKVWNRRVEMTGIEERSEMDKPEVAEGHDDGVSGGDEEDDEDDDETSGDDEDKDELHRNLKDISAQDKNGISDPTQLNMLRLKMEAAETTLADLRSKLRIAKQKKSQVSIELRQQAASRMSRNAGLSKNVEEQKYPASTKTNTLNRRSKHLQQYSEDQAIAGKVDQPDSALEFSMNRSSLSEVPSSTASVSRCTQSSSVRGTSPASTTLTEPDDLGKGRRERRPIRFDWDNDENSPFDPSAWFIPRNMAAFADSQLEIWRDFLNDQLGFRGMEIKNTALPQIALGYRTMPSVVAPNESAKATLPSKGAKGASTLALSSETAEILSILSRFDHLVELRHHGSRPTSQSYAVEEWEDERGRFRVFYRSWRAFLEQCATRNDRAECQRFLNAMTVSLDAIRTNLEEALAVERQSRPAFIADDQVAVDSVRSLEGEELSVRHRRIHESITHLNQIMQAFSKHVAMTSIDIAQQRRRILVGMVRFAALKEHMQAKHHELDRLEIDSLAKLSLNMEGVPCPLCTKSVTDG